MDTNEPVLLIYFSVW